MSILALDTCFGACSVAVRVASPGQAPRDIGERVLMDVGHAEALAPMIARVLAAAGLEARAITRIAVTHGPGTFTGTRIAIAAARGLALATGAPIVAFSSLLAIGIAAARARDLAANADAAVLVAMDARNRQYYVQVIGGDGAELTQPQLLSADAAAALVPGRRLLAVGTGAAGVVAAGAAAARTIETAFADAAARDQLQPDAAMLLDLALGATPGRTAPAPLYLRPPDAKPPTSPALPRADV